MPWEQQIDISPGHDQTAGLKRLKALVTLTRVMPVRSANMRWVRFIFLQPIHGALDCDVSCQSVLRSSAGRWISLESQAGACRLEQAGWPGPFW